MSLSSSFQLPPPRKSGNLPTTHTTNTSHRQQHVVPQQDTITHQAGTLTTTSGDKSNNNRTTTSVTTTAPSYEERCRLAKIVSKLSPEEKKHSKSKLFVPRTIKDYDDGGSFPEIHVAQYPRNMGNPHLRRQLTPNLSSNVVAGGGRGTSSSNQQQLVIANSNVVNVEIDQDGKVSYDSIVKGGTNSDKIVYTKLQDMRGGKPNESDVALPTRDQEVLEAERTNNALMAILNQKTALDKPSGTAIINASTSLNVEQNTQYIKYSAKPDAPGYNPSASSNRIIQMVPKQIDPFMPPKHKHNKAPRGPAEDPVPILHAPPRKLTKEEREQWNIPACISNWKNARGYTIPLDKRLAADGRGLIDNTINSDQFAALSESLYVAEQQARQEVRMRALIQKKQLLQERTQREEDLRQLANQARLERNQTINQASSSTIPIPNERNITNKHDDDDSDHSSASSESFRGIGANRSNNQQQQNNNQPPPRPPTIIETDDDIAARQRDKLRIERKKERERELRIEKNVELKRKQKFEEERDVSEKIALGQHVGTGGTDAGIDSRLYNQSAGMDTGFGADDEYNAYTKPLFGDRSTSTTNNTNSIYRPTRNDTINEYNADEQYDKIMNDGITSKFQPDKGFAGAGGKGHQVPTSQPRTLPVQFEREQPK